jgi:hypothetical protein
VMGNLHRWIDPLQMSQNSDVGWIGQQTLRDSHDGLNGQ